LSVASALNRAFTTILTLPHHVNSFWESFFEFTIFLTG
jgi:hypothetical protein